MLSPHTIATATTLLTCQDSSANIIIGDTWRDRAGTEQVRPGQCVGCHGEKNNTHKRCIHHVCCVSNQMWNYKQKQNKNKLRKK